MELQETVCQALIYEGGVGASSEDLLITLQDKISKILKKGDFHIKSWKTSGQDGCNKYLGMTWNQKDDCDLLKFRLNLHQ